MPSFRFALTAALVAFAPALAWAQAYPAKAIRVIVPFAAGGTNDMVARLLGQKLNAAWGQSVTIDNRPGAGGNIGTELAAKAPADGYTLLVTTSSFVINPSLYREIRYDPVRDFAPVSLLTKYMLYLVVHPSLPARSVKSLIGLAKARPGQINYASSGIGLLSHIAGELFSSMAGVRMTHIEYKSASPAIIALISGEVGVHFGGVTVLPHVKAGKLALLGVSGATRSPLLPDVPTLAESGLPGYEAITWIALFAPAATPVPVIRRISEETVKGLGQPDVVQIFEKQDLQAAAGTPEALATLVRMESAKWAKVVKNAGIKYD